MSEEKVIDYSRQRKVNLAFPLLTAIFVILGAWFRIVYSSGLYFLLVVYFGIPTLVLLFSGAMGAASKRAIDYIPGEWKRQKVWVSYSEYERMIRDHEKAYGNLYAHPAAGLTCCVLLPLSLGLGALSVLYLQYEPPFLGGLIDSLILVAVQYGIVSMLGFLVGYRMVRIDSKTFFEPPKLGDVYKYSRMLASVKGIRAGVSVDVGEQGDTHTILGTECKTYVEGLPDTVMIKVQVSRSGFIYPYIVGTIYKGKVQDKESKRVEINTRYPALFEYSMDKDVAVIVARFDIPERSSDVPSVSSGAFRALAAELVQVLRNNYKP